MRYSYLLTSLLLLIGSSSYADNTALKLAQEKNCLTCHNGNNKILGPPYKLVAAKYKGDSSAENRLVAKIQAGGGGTWGHYKMPANDVSDAEGHILVQWVLAQAQ